MKVIIIDEAKVNFNKLDGSLKSKSSRLSKN